MSTQKSKNCAVCGDKALGYNFNAVTCESCKAFFRRNALAKKEFTCPFSQNCEITVVTRRFCQKCRLKKCLDIGMKSENIMSEEDKLIKRRKIENNRAKRRLNEKKSNEDEVEVEESKSAAADSSGFDAYGHSYDSQSCGSFESSNGTMHPTSSTPTNFADNLPNLNPELMTSEEMVEFIVSDPDRASQAISRLMRTPVEAMASLEKIINSSKDALRLISHLIAYPGDALKIISKIMNSPFNALTVFTKFMSSPTDALEIISKIVSSPQDVLQFIKNLMDSPEDALDIMNKFMNTPAEALKMLNKIFNGNATEDVQTQTLSDEPKEILITPPTTVYQNNEPDIQTIREQTVIHTMLNINSPGEMSSELQSPPPPPIGINPYTPPLESPMSYNEPSSDTSIQYHSPNSLHDINVDNLPSTSAGLLPTSSPTNIHEVADFSNDPSVYELRSFIQNTYNDNPLIDGINSLDSVLTEVIRIEFQAFNNLPVEPRVKYEQSHQQHSQNMNCPQQDQSFQMPENQLNGNYYNPNQQQPISSPSSISFGRDLNETEQMKLRELKLASEALFYPVDEDLSVLMMGDDRIKTDDTHQDPKLLQLLNLTAVAIKRLIKMAKKISAFRDMCQEDQVALLKGGCTEMMIMRSVMTYDDDRNSWKIPHTKENMSNIRAEVLKLAKGNVYEEHIKFISTFDEKWRMDENIILIMCAIVLFSPNRARIIHGDVIRLEQNSYYYLLRRYLESVYPGCEAKSAFIKLVQKISDVERLNQVIIGVYLNVNPSQVEPLLREIFDLKNF